MKFRREHIQKPVEAKGVPKKMGSRNRRRLWVAHRETSAAGRQTGCPRHLKGTDPMCDFMCSNFPDEIYTLGREFTNESMANM